MSAEPVQDLSAEVESLLQSPPRTVDSARAESLAWALKQAVQAAWMVDPPRAEQAQASLHRLAQARATPVLTALAAWGAGIVCLARGELEPAVERLDQAAGTWQELGLGLPAAQVGVARLMPLSLLGRYDEALASGSAAETALTRLGDLQGSAKVALNLGSLAIHRGRYTEAANHYRRAAVRFARAGDREHSVMADVGLADARGFEGRLDEAARIYDRAEMRARQHGLPVLAAQAGHGRALLALGAGRYRSALAGLVRAQAEFGRIGVDHYLGEVERDLADAYLELNLLPEALAIYDRLLTRLRAQGNAATLPWLHLQRARALARAGQGPSAAQGLQAAGDQFRAQGHAAGQALSGLALLELCLSLAEGGNGDELATLARLAAAMVTTQPRAPMWRLHLVQAVALRRLGRPDEVLRLLRPQVELQQSHWPPQARPRLWDEIGRAHRAQGQRAAAVEAFERAVVLFEQWQSALPGEEFQLAALADHLHPFEARLALSLDGETPESVLAWLDRHRARVLGDRLGRGREFDVPAGSVDAECGARRARLNWIRRQARRRAEEGNDDLPPALYEEATQLEHALLEQARRDRLARDEDTLAPGAAMRPPGLDLGTLRRRFVGTRALVEYGISGDELFALVVARGQVHVVRRLASWAAVKVQLHRLHYQLDTLRAGSRRLQAHAAQLTQRCGARLQALHDAVWRPLQALLAGIDDTIVVPCQALQSLPFPALHDGSDWLDERMRITLAPAAALAPTAPLPATPARALVVGEGQRLLHMQHEVEAVATELQAERVLMDGMATVDAVIAAARQADVLHLACHGEFRGDNPRFSALHLGDGLLSAAAVETLRLPARLVVLSACETGRTQTAAGDEGLGLVRAFQLAGARDVVASLWAVDDEATAHFMTAFYRGWGRGRLDVATALQQARQAMRRRWPHPFYWAAFQGYARADL